MSRIKRALYRTTEILDYRTFVVATVFLVVLLVGYTTYSAFQAAHDSTVAANQRGKAATSRINKLTAEIENLQREITQGRDERGQLATAVEALAEQVRRMGGRPILAATTAPRSPAAKPPSPKPTPARTATPTPSPRPSSTPTVTPSPSPSCSPLPIVGCLPARPRSA